MKLTFIEKLAYNFGRLLKIVCVIATVLLYIVSILTIFDKFDINIMPFGFCKQIDIIIFNNIFTFFI